MEIQIHRKWKEHVKFTTVKENFFINFLIEDREYQMSSLDSFKNGHCVHFKIISIYARNNVFWAI